MAEPAADRDDDSLLTGLLQSGLMYVAVRALGDPDDARDALQETLARALTTVSQSRCSGGREQFREVIATFTRGIAIAPDGGELAGSTDWLWMSRSRAGRHGACVSVVRAGDRVRRMARVRVYCRRGGVEATALVRAVALRASPHQRMLAGQVEGAHI